SFMAALLGRRAHLVQPTQGRASALSRLVLAGLELVLRHAAVRAGPAVGDVLEAGAGGEAPRPQTGRLLLGEAAGAPIGIAVGRVRHGRLSPRRSAFRPRSGPGTPRARTPRALRSGTRSCPR